MGRGLPAPHDAIPPRSAPAGYTFWPPLFPSPGHFFKYLAARGVATTLNKHPAAGVQFHEANYAAMATHMGMDPAKGAAADCGLPPGRIPAPTDVLPFRCACRPDRRIRHRQRDVREGPLQHHAQAHR